MYNKDASLCVLEAKATGDNNWWTDHCSGWEACLRNYLSTRRSKQRILNLEEEQNPALDSQSNADSGRSLLSQLQHRRPGGKRINEY